MNYRGHSIENKGKRRLKSMRNACFNHDFCPLLYVPWFTVFTSIADRGQFERSAKKTVNNTKKKQARRRCWTNNCNLRIRPTKRVRSENGVECGSSCNKIIRKIIESNMNFGSQIFLLSRTFISLQIHCDVDSEVVQNDWMTGIVYRWSTLRANGNY